MSDPVISSCLSLSYCADLQVVSGSVVSSCLSLSYCADLKVVSDPVVSSLILRIIQFVRRTKEKVLRVNYLF